MSDEAVGSDMAGAAGAAGAAGGADAVRIRLRTPRFALRDFTTADAGELVALDADPRVRRFTGGGPAPSEADVRRGPLARILAWHERSGDLGYWWIHERGPAGRLTAPPLGWVHLRPVIWADRPLDPDPRQALEVGWRLHPRAWGRGAATETAAALVADAFDRLGATRVAAVALPDNDASFRVMERLGLHFAGIRRLHGGARCIEYARDAATPMRPGPGPAPARVLVRDAAADDDQERRSIATLLTEAFGGPAEAAVLAALRATGRASCVLVATDPGTSALLGVVAVSPAASPAGVACLGPVAVRAQARGRCIGARLVRAALLRAAGQGFEASAVLGDPSWSARFGYEPAVPLGFTSRWTSCDAFMVRALEGGRLPPPGPIEWDPAFDAAGD